MIAVKLNLTHLSILDGFAIHMQGFKFFEQKHFYSEIISLLWYSIYFRQFIPKLLRLGSL